MACALRRYGVTDSGLRHYTSNSPKESNMSSSTTNVTESKKSHLDQTQPVFASVFSWLFLCVSAAVLLSSLYSALGYLLKGEDLTQFTLKVVNGCVISIALYELAMVISTEYGQQHDSDVIVMLRRTLPRFIGTVAIALSLEGLIMVIKYSQLDLAGNLYYPVAIIISAAVLLIALGIFLRLAPVQDSNPS
ncbi:MAG: hypothetical protein P8X74_00545 [Reinekea sp.]